MFLWTGSTACLKYFKYFLRWLNCTYLNNARPYMFVSPKAIIIPLIFNLMDDLISTKMDDVGFYLKILVACCKQDLVTFKQTIH